MELKRKGFLDHYPEIEKLKRYLEHLISKSQHSIEGFGEPSGLPNLEPKGRPKQILEAINKSHQVTMEDAEALLQAIEEGEIPIRFDSSTLESNSLR